MSVNYKKGDIVKIVKKKFGNTTGNTSESLGCNWEIPSSYNGLIGIINNISHNSGISYQLFSKKNGEYIGWYKREEISKPNKLSLNIDINFYSKYL